MRARQGKGGGTFMRGRGTYGVQRCIAEAVDLECIPAQRNAPKNEKVCRYVKPRKESFRQQHYSRHKKIRKRVAW